MAFAVILGTSESLQCLVLLPPSIPHHSPRESAWNNACRFINSHLYLVRRNGSPVHVQDAAKPLQRLTAAAIRAETVEWFVMNYKFTQKRASTTGVCSLYLRRVPAEIKQKYIELCICHRLHPPPHSTSAVHINISQLQKKNKNLVGNHTSTNRQLI